MNRKKLFNKSYLVALSVYFCVVNGKALAEDDILSMSLEQVLDIPVDLASKGLKQTIRQAPGSITVLDSTFIKNSGARDLAELLEMVPGFQLGSNVLNGSYLGFRGGISQGGILLRIDGQEMNEMNFFTVQWENHYPAATIEKVEIIRGPGSVLYGGSAELAVIEVTTKRPSEDKTGLVNANVGVTENARSHLQGTAWVSYGDKDEYISVSGTNSDADRGSGPYTDYYGNTFDMEDASQQSADTLNVAAKYGDFSANYLRDNYGGEQQNGFFINFATPNTIRFWSERAEIKYAPQLTDELSLAIKANWSYDRPWISIAGEEDQAILNQADPTTYAGFFYNKHAYRLQYTADATYKATDEIALLVGTQYFEDTGGGAGNNFLGQPVPNYSAYNGVVYGQLTYQPSFMTVTAGTRYEENSNYGGQVVSRLALTKSEPDWHAKLQVAQSFRAPGNEATVNFYSPLVGNDNIEPETTLVTEAEFGHKLGSRLYATANVFQWKTEDTITYFFSPEHGDSYDNLGDSGAWGAEGNLRYRYDRGDISLSYVFMEADNDNAAFSVFNTDGSVLDDNYFIGQAQNVITLTGSYEITSNFTLFTSLNYIGERYLYTSVLDDGITLVPEKVSSLPLWRAAATYRGLGWDKLDVQLGVNNILGENDESNVYPNFKNATTPSMPRLDREFFASATIHW